MIPASSAVGKAQAVSDSRPRTTMPGLPCRLIALMCTLCVGAAHAHGGGLNREGCHNDRKNGGYHCHRGPVASPPAQPLKPRTTPASQQPPARSPIQSQPVQRIYRNCTDALEAGAAPVRRGDPGYGPHLDRDNDGVGCEPYRGR